MGVLSGIDSGRVKSIQISSLSRFKIVPYVKVFKTLCSRALLDEASDLLPPKFFDQI